MAFSMESRLPFLDQELVDWVLRLPPSAIVHDGWSRAILRDGLKGVLTEKVRTRRWKVGFTTPETRWLRARRARRAGAVPLAAVLRPAVLGRRRPGRHVRAVLRRRGGAVADLLACDQHRALDACVLRPRRRLAARRGAGRALRPRRRRVARRPRTNAAAAALAQFSAHDQRHLFARSTVDGRDYARAPIRTRLFVGGDSLLDGLRDALRDVELAPDDVVAISEKAVAICQGRSYPVEEVRARPLARTLSRFVGRTASGIGLGIPATMELAIREAGEARILAATAAAAVTKPFGVKGVFYRVAGPAVRAIDGPTTGTIPPYDGHAKLGPDDPDGVAREVARRAGGGRGGDRRQRHRRERARRLRRRRSGAGGVAAARQPARTGRPADTGRAAPSGLRPTTAVILPPVSAAEPSSGGRPNRRRRGGGGGAGGGSGGSGGGSGGSGDGGRGGGTGRGGGGGGARGKSGAGAGGRSEWGGPADGPAEVRAPR